MRVRWALKEVGEPYDVRLLTFEELKVRPYRDLHPFGQIPTYQQGQLDLFESGAIVFHIADNHPGLLPEDPILRARAISWMFSALNTMEPPIVEREMSGYTEGKKAWYRERLSMLDGRVHVRLGELSTRLGASDWLDETFTAGDLLMVTVLRRLEGTGLLEKYPNLVSYVGRAKERPAYKRAYRAQFDVWERNNR